MPKAGKSCHCLPFSFIHLSAFMPTGVPLYFPLPRPLYVCTHFLSVWVTQWHGKWKWQFHTWHRRQTSGAEVNWGHFRPFSFTWLRKAGVVTWWAGSSWVMLDLFAFSILYFVRMKCYSNILYCVFSQNVHFFDLHHDNFIYMFWFWTFISWSYHIIIIGD